MKTVPEIAMDFLRRGGKRLRPRICEAAWRSLSGGDASRVAPLAEAVECLHKASLIHDDIEDGDDQNAKSEERDTVNDEEQKRLKALIDKAESLLKKGEKK